MLIAPVWSILLCSVEPLHSPEPALGHKQKPTGLNRWVSICARGILPRAPVLRPSVPRAGMFAASPAHHFVYMPIIISRLVKPLSILSDGGIVGSHRPFARRGHRRQAG